MRILYVTWGETPRPFGVYKTQVCNLLSCLHEQGHQVHLFSAVPFINSALVREKDYADRMWKQITTDYAHINPRRQFTIAPQPLQRVLQGNLAIRAPFWSGIGALARQIDTLLPDIVHCRSYHATHAALSARKRATHKPKVIFDMRGFYPEEVLKHKGMTDFPPAYDRLKDFERTLLTQSDAVAVLNQEMFDVVQDVPDEKKHIHYPPVKLAQTTKTLGAPTQPPIYLFTGAIGDNIWHSQNNLILQFQSILQRQPDARLKLATLSASKEYQRILETFGPNRVEVTSYSTEQERSELFQSATFGLLPYTDKIEGPAVKIGQTLLGTKTVEYLCEGIPVIVNDKCMAAARLVAEYDMGIICTPDVALPETADLTAYTSIKKRQEILNTAQSLFALENVANGYAELYKDLVSAKAVA